MVIANNKGFTLIEMLVVIAIVAILTAVVLLALNPAELLRKGRDSTRFQELTTLRKAIDATIASGSAGSLPLCAGTGGCSSVGGNRAANGTGWLPMDLTAFVPTLPVDPRNGQAGNNAGGAPVTFQYQFRGNAAGQYEVRTYLESADNNNRIVDDGGSNQNTTGNAGGTANGFYEVGTNLNLL